MFNSDFAQSNYFVEESSNAEHVQQSSDDTGCETEEYQSQFAFLDEDTKTESTSKKLDFPEFVPTFTPYESRTP